MNLKDLKPENLVRFAAYPLVVLVAGGAFVALLRQLGTRGLFLVFLLFLLASPVAYLIRRTRHGPSHREGARRGAERTPSLPPNEDVR